MSTGRAPQGVIWVCVDCTLMWANGEATESPDREPWSAMPAEASWTMGILDTEHAEGCDPATRDDVECGCERLTFSARPCDGCGSTLGGERHAFTLWGDAGSNEAECDKCEATGLFPPFDWDADGGISWGEIADRQCPECGGSGWTR